MDASAKALTPPPSPELLADARFYESGFFYMYKYMLLKQENPEMDDFERKKALNSLDFFSF